MDLSIHNQILWHACRRATQKLQLGAENPRSPLLHFPRLVRGGWINDMNQASCFFDFTGAPGGYKQFPEEFFRQLWACDQKELFNELTTQMSANFATAAAAKMEPLQAALYDVGKYDPADHLDELPVEPGNVNHRFEANAESGLTPAVHRAIYKVAATRLYTAMSEGGVDRRLSTEKLTLLGRALHTVQDFYAHTNYVELLLWRMASQNRLRQPIVARCNSPADFLEPHSLAHKRFVLRGTGDSGWNPADDVFFAYRASPDETPLTGGEFDTLDTLYTILGVYRRQLMAVGEDSNQEDLLISLIFGVVDLPRKNLIRFLLKVYDAYKTVVEGIGQYARQAAIKLIETELVAHFPAKVTQVRSVCAVFEQYDSADANRWARAGKLLYLQHVIELRLLERFKGHTGASPLRLPNHSLLAKDYPAADPVDDLRFNVACRLAAGASTDLIAAFFSGEDDYQSILLRHVVHPSRHSADDLEKRIGVVGQYCSAYWRDTY